MTQVPPLDSNHIGTVLVPWRTGLYYPGYGIDPISGTVKDQIITETGALINTHQGDATDFYVSFGIDSSMTSQGHQASIDMKYRAALATAAAGGSLTDQRQRDEESSEFSVTFYSSKPFFVVDLPPTYVDGKPTYPSHPVLEELRRAYELAKTSPNGSLDDFYALHGTHLILGVQCVQGAVVDALFASQASRSLSMYSIYGSVNYQGFSASGQDASIRQSITGSERFSLRYRTVGYTTPPTLPDLPSNPRDIFSNNYINKMKLALGVRSGGLIQDATSLDDLVGTPSVARCVPFNILFGDQVSPSPVLLLSIRILNLWERYAGAERTLSDLKARAALGFLSTADQNRVPAVIQSAHERKIVLNGLLTQLAGHPEEESAIELELNNLAPVNLIDLPKLYAQPSGSPHSNGHHIYQQLLIPKQPEDAQVFKIKSYFVGNPQAHDPDTALFTHDIFSSNNPTNMPEWDLIRDAHDQPLQCDSRAWALTVRISDSGWNGTFRIDLVYGPEELLLSAVYVNYPGQGRELP